MNKRIKKKRWKKKRKESKELVRRAESEFGMDDARTLIAGFRHLTIYGEDLVGLRSRITVRSVPRAVARELYMNGMGWSNTGTRWGDE